MAKICCAILPWPLRTGLVSQMNKHPSHISALVNNVTPSHQFKNSWTDLPSLLSVPTNTGWWSMYTVWSLWKVPKLPAFLSHPVFMGTFYSFLQLWKQFYLSIFFSAFPHEFLMVLPLELFNWHLNWHLNSCSCGICILCIFYRWIVQVKASTLFIPFSHIDFLVGGGWGGEEVWRGRLG